MNSGQNARRLFDELLGECIAGDPERFRLYARLGEAADDCCAAAEQTGWLAALDHTAALYGRAARQALSPTPQPTTRPRRRTAARAARPRKETTGGT